jgi:hypothetical protein
MTVACRDPQLAFYLFCLCTAFALALPVIPRSLPHARTGQHVVHTHTQQDKEEFTLMVLPKLKR